MSRMSAFLIGLCIAGSAVPAYAANYGPAGMGMGRTSGDTRMGAGGRMKGECLMDRAGMGGDCMLMGRHKMSGTVTMINHSKGTLVLKNGVADMTLHFPPDAIKSLKNGDTITVYLGFRMAEPVVTD